MWTFLLTRVLQALFTLWVVSVLVFFAARLTGSPDLALLPPDALPEQRQAFKQAYGLDQPVLVQYWRWISRAVQGDLGQGIQHKIAVRELMVAYLLAADIVARLPSCRLSDDHQPGIMTRNRVSTPRLSLFPSLCAHPSRSIPRSSTGILC